MKITEKAAESADGAAVGTLFGVPVSGQLQNRPSPFCDRFTPRAPYNHPCNGGPGCPGPVSGEGRDTVTVVYIDSVFVLNALMDYLLLLSAGRLAGVPCGAAGMCWERFWEADTQRRLFLPGMEFLSGCRKAAAGVLLALTAFRRRAEAAAADAGIFSACPAVGRVCAGIGNAFRRGDPGGQRCFLYGRVRTGTAGSCRGGLCGADGGIPCRRPAWGGRGAAADAGVRGRP